MARASASRTTERRAKQSAGGLPKGGAGRTKVVQRDTKAGHVVVSKARFEAVMRAAEQSGLLREKSSRIGGRVSHFAEAFKESRGKVDPDLKLGF